MKRAGIKCVPVPSNILQNFLALECHDCVWDGKGLHGRVVIIAKEHYYDDA